jgi:hypothetical protein
MALDLIESRADSKGVMIQVYRPAGRDTHRPCRPRARDVGGPLGDRPGQPYGQDPPTLVTRSISAVSGSLRPGAPVAGGLVQPHGRDRSTATSGNSSGEP